jgi:hypothetical protein
LASSRFGEELLKRQVDIGARKNSSHIREILPGTGICSAYATSSVSPHYSAEEGIVREIV